MPCLTLWRPLSCFALTALLGCTGAVVEDGNTDPLRSAGAEKGARHFSCQAPRQPAAQALRRLSQQQYQRSVHALVQRNLPSEAASILAAVEPLLSQYPADQRITAPNERRGGFSALDVTVQQGHADAAYAVAVALGAELSKSAARRMSLLGGCATDSATNNDRACLEGFIRSFGAQVLRKPLSDADVAFYLEVSEEAPGGVKPALVAAPVVADVVALLFASPQFLLRVEHGDGEEDTVPLSAYELAARLALHFWQSTPDAALTQAAQSGALLTESGYRAQVDRLAADARTQNTYEEFFSQWLALEDLPELDSLAGSPLFQAFAGEDLPTERTRADAIGDVLRMFQRAVEAGGTASDLLNDRRSYARDPSVARLYQSEVWSGTGEAPLPSSPARAGLLTRVAFLATGTPQTRPIMKGVRVRNTLMCQTILPPPNNAAADTPRQAGGATTREVITALTESSDTCGSCHRTLINPLGFATENFDSLGRERSSETFFDEAGRVTGQGAVQTHSVPHLTPQDAAEVSGAVDLTRMLDESGFFHACLARQYFRFSFGRHEDEEKDGCALAELEAQALEKRPLQELLKSTALMPEFKLRSFQ